MVHRLRDDLLDGRYTDRLTEPLALDGYVLAVPLGDHLNAEITSSRGH